MNIRNLLIYTVLSCCAVVQPAEAFVQASAVNSPEAVDYLSRARSMFADRNYVGCLDQLQMMNRRYPSAAEVEEGARLRALASLHMGDDGALTLLKKFLADYPSSPYRAEISAAVGDYYFGRSAYSEAYRAYTSFDFSSLSGNILDDALYRRSYSALMLAELPTAVNGFEALASKRGEYRTASIFYLGYIAYTEGDYAKALKYLPETTSDHELGGAAEYYLAQIEFARGNYSKAYSLAAKALKRDAVPEFAPEANRIAGESLFNLGRQEEAIGYLRRYLATTKEQPKPSASYILGVSEYRAGEYDRAIEALSHASNAEDAMGQSANLFLGQAYVMKSNTDAALIAFEKAYRMNYDRDVSETALYNYAVAKSRGGRVPFGNSVALFEGFLHQYPDSRYAASVQDYIVTGYLTDNDYESALKAIDSMRSPSAKVLDAKQRALFALGTRDYASGRYTSALNRFQAAAATGSDSGIARQSQLWIGDSQFELERYAQASNSYRNFLKATPSSDPNAIIARYNLGYAEFAEGNYGDALKQFRAVIDASPSTPGMLPDAYNRAADCLYYSSDFDGAYKLYNLAYEHNPASGDYALYQQAIMQGLMRNQREKILRLDNLMEQFPSSGLIPAAMLEKAESYASLDDNRRAIATYSELVERYPSSPYARKGLLQLAITYRSTGNAGEAEEAYKKVVSTYPTSEEARLAADDLKQIYADRGQLDRYMAFIRSIPDAPQTDPSELEALAFRSAEADFVNNDRTDRLEKYLIDYPKGVHEPQALYLLAQAATTSGNNEQALTISSRLIASYPDAEASSDVLLIKADAESNLGRYAEALDSYRQLENRTASTNTQRQARLGIMRTAAELAEYPTVITAADKLLTSSATTLIEVTEVKFTRALALDKSGSSYEAVKVWKELSENPADIYGSRAAVALAEAYLAAGDTKNARAVADEFINANPPHSYWLARGFIVLSDALRADGDSFEADEYLRSLRNNYPGDEQEIFEMIDSRLQK